MEKLKWIGDKFLKMEMQTKSVRGQQGKAKLDIGGFASAVLNPAACLRE